MAEVSNQGEPGRRPEKSAAAFRTISEVASVLDVPAHVLRFWESKFTQIKPLKRGGGRRYYRPEDIDLLRNIRELLYTDGYTIKGVQKLLREGGVKALGRSAARPGRAPGARPEPAQIEQVRAAAASAARADTRLDPTTRAELRRILTELEAMRDLLRGGDGGGRD